MNFQKSGGNAGGFLAEFGGIFGYLFLVFGPVLALLLPALQTAFSKSADLFLLAIPTGSRLTLLGKSIGLSTAVALGGTGLGLLCSLFLLNTSSPVRRILRWIILLLAPLPAYIYALAWTSFSDQINNWLMSLIPARLILRGWGVSWWIWVMALLPFSTSLLLLGFESIEPDQIEAARLLSRDNRVIRKIMVPLIKPYLIVSLSFLFLLSLTDYSVPALFQTSGYSLSLFADFSAYHQPERVLFLSLPMLLIGGLIILLTLKELKKRPLAPVWRKKQTLSIQAEGWMEWLQNAGLVFLLIQVGIPLLSLFSLNHAEMKFWENILAARDEIQFTSQTGLAAAAACLPLASGFASWIYRKNSLTGWVWVILPLIIPPSLIGIGLISLWNSPQIISVYNSEWMPILASIARFTPYAVLILFIQRQTLNQNLLDAADLIPANPLKKWFWITLPLSAPGLISSALFVFILSLGELGATLLVVPAGSSTLTIRIYNYLHYGASDTVWSLALVLTLLAVVSGLFILLILTGWNQLSTRNQLS